MAALPLRGVPEAQLKLSLPPAPELHSAHEAAHESLCVPAQGIAQQQGQSRLMPAEEAQAAEDDSLHQVCFPGIRRDLHQLPVQPGPQGLEGIGVPPAEECPRVDVEASHWSRRHWPRGWWLGSCVGMAATGSCLPRSGVCWRVGCRRCAGLFPEPSSARSECRMELTLLLQRGTRACSQPSTGCAGSRAGAGKAPCSSPPPSCPGTLDSGSPEQRPCCPGPSCRRGLWAAGDVVLLSVTATAADGTLEWQRSCHHLLVHG